MRSLKNEKILKRLSGLEMKQGLKLLERPNKKLERSYWFKKTYTKPILLNFDFSSTNLKEG